MVSSSFRMDISIIGNNHVYNGHDATFFGLAAGYFVARWMGYDLKIAKTLAIEIGLQNSGLGAALAVKYFGAVAALPAALFSVWHNISGALLARYWKDKI